jgi:hypothetical protein
MASAARKMNPQTAPAPDEPKRPGWTLSIDELEAMMERAAAIGAAQALDQHQRAAWLDQERIATHLGISAPTLRKLIEAGLPFSWAEGRGAGEGKRLFCVEEVDAWMKQRRHAAQAKE